MKRPVINLWKLAVFVGILAFPPLTFGGPKVFVTNYALKFFSERIGGENITVVFPVPEGMSPVFWMPNRRTVGAMQKADLIIINGANFEKWLMMVSLPPSKVVNTSAGFRNQYIYVPDAITHSHGAEGKHSHPGIRHTTWIDFRLAVKQARAIEKALSKRVPEMKTEFEKRYLSLEKDLLALDTRVRKVLGNDCSQPLLASHPEYDYFARGYSLNLKSVLWFPKVMPDPGQWKTLEGILHEHPAKWMIWEGEPIKEVSRKLHAMEIKSIVLWKIWSGSLNSQREEG